MKSETLRFNAQQSTLSHVNVLIDVEGRSIEFRLDRKNRRWHSLVEPEEAAFPLFTVVEEKRYELYSDATFGDA
jgi:hypothetical protein